MSKAQDVILRPVVSEKTYALADDMGGERNPVYTFLVRTSANKIEIRQAVQDAFNVTVEKVNVANRQGKRKRNRGMRTFGKRSNTKRAYVTLSVGQSIPLFES